MGFFPNPLTITRLLKKYKIDPLSGCWEFKKYTRRDGYAVFHIGPKSYKAHRVMFEVFVRELEPGEDVHHTCHNRKCGNPFHLEAGTEAENLLDAEKHRWIETQLVGGPWDGAIRSINPSHPEEHLVIKDRDGLHTYTLLENEYSYAGVRKVKSRKAVRVVRGTSVKHSALVKKRRQERREREAAEPKLYDSVKENELCHESQPSSVRSAVKKETISTRRSTTTKHISSSSATPRTGKLSKPKAA